MSQYPLVSKLPACSFGIRCTRINPHHWRTTQHPGHPKPIVKPDELEKILKNSSPLDEPNNKRDVLVVSSSEKSDNSNQSSLASKLPVCDYGVRCYRQNPHHWQTHWHPGHPKPVIKPADLERMLTGSNYVCRDVKERVQIDEIVRYVLGMDEHRFRNVFKFNNTIASYERSHEQVFKDAGIDPVKWYEEWPLRKLITQSKSTMRTIEDLKKSVGKPPEASKPVKFTIQVLDPRDPEKANVATISSAPENKGATIQVATAAAFLEGVSGNPDSTLSGCARSPVQGEFAMFAAIASYIARKYRGIAPVDEMDKSEDYFKFPWANIFGPKGKGYTVPDGPTRFSINYDSNKLSKFSPELVETTSIGLCENAPVSFGAIVDKKDPIKFSSMKAVPPEENQFVHHALTPAFNIGKMLKNNVPKDEIDKLNGVAETILHAAYMGTVLAASIFESKKVFLTLVGGSAFRNPISFIANAINQVFESGYANVVDEIILVFHPARGKWISDTSPMRSPSIDKQFFAALKPIAGNNELIKLLWEYTDLMYGQPRGELPSDNVDKASRLATKINSMQK